MKILVIDAHPDSESFCRALAESYQKGAAEAGAECNLVHLNELEFNPMLGAGYRIPMSLEPDLLRIQEMIKDSEHIVFVYPNWWGTYPALLKGFLDRTFLPGFAFAHTNKAAAWDKLLRGRSGRLIVTMDTPKWYYHVGFNAPGHHAMKKCVMGYCGIKPVKTLIVTPVKNSTAEQRQLWLEKIYAIGKKDAK
ncbi:MAG: NADPH:quinone reductase [Bacteroidetes bacterium HGW-Bacteroidetes-6]|jgi:putative NADPH-quinone reductase|nr:MAG: NADPH:quinone reductase [Bacteroidetes bacterium HGW-Bacteroidetes-6]